MPWHKATDAMSGAVVPGDEAAYWSQKQLIEMDRRFRERVTNALAQERNTRKGKHLAANGAQESPRAELIFHLNQQDMFARPR